LRSRRLTLDPDKARAACAAYRDVIDRQMQKNWMPNLAFRGNTPQVFWREVIGGLDSFKARRSAVQQHDARLPGRRRGTAVSMAFAEVVPALNNAWSMRVTGSLSGNTAAGRGHQSIYPMSLRWSINVLAVNLDVEAARSQTQAFLLEQFSRPTKTK